MKIKKLFLVTVLFIGVVCEAQEDPYQLCIKSTSLAVHKAQKEMIHAKKTDVNGLLARAVILQNHAISLFQSKNNSRAVCISVLARQYAIKIIALLNSKEKNAYNVSDNENMLLGHCADELTLYSESKAFANYPSELDESYMYSFNQLQVDLK